jgi:hypothetical protein
MKKSRGSLAMKLNGEMCRGENCAMNDFVQRPDNDRMRRLARYAALRERSHVPSPDKECTPPESGASCFWTFHTGVEETLDGSWGDQSWRKRNRPKNAVWKFLRIPKEQGRQANNREPLSFQIGCAFEDKLLITVGPGGSLRPNNEQRSQTRCDAGKSDEKL